MDQFVYVGCRVELKLNVKPGQGIAQSRCVFRDNPKEFPSGITKRSFPDIVRRYTFGRFRFFARASQFMTSKCVSSFLLCADSFALVFAFNVDIALKQNKRLQNNEPESNEFFFFAFYECVSGAVSAHVE